MFRAPGLSSVAVASVGNYTVVFLGTVNGYLLKVGLEGPRGEGFEGVEISFPTGGCRMDLVGSPAPGPRRHASVGKAAAGLAPPNTRPS